MTRQHIETVEITEEGIGNLKYLLIEALKAERNSMMGTPVDPRISIFLKASTRFLDGFETPPIKPRNHLRVVK